MPKKPTLTARVEELLTVVRALVAQLTHNDVKVADAVRERERWKAQAESAYKALLIERMVKNDSRALLPDAESEAAAARYKEEAEVHARKKRRAR